MDDGLQNPRLYKDLSLLVVDGASGFGNRPRAAGGAAARAGVAGAAARCQAAVLIGPDPPGVTAFCRYPCCAQTAPGPEIGAFVGRRVFAFAGIARPEKFFSMLAEAGVIVVPAMSFPDHQPFVAATCAAS